MHQEKSTWHIPAGFERRTYAAVPASACFDKRMSRAHLRALMIICLHCNKSGETYVSHARIGACLGISRELAGRYYRALLNLGYLERIGKRRQGYITRVVYLNPSMKRMQDMAKLDPQVVALGRKHLDRIAEQLKKQGTRVRRDPKHKELTQVPRTGDTSQKCLNPFLDDV